VHTSNFPSGKSVSSDRWEDFSDLFREGRQPLPRAWADVFGPLRKGTVDDLVIVGQIGQSLDGRIATASGSAFRRCCNSWSVVVDGTSRPCRFPGIRSRSLLKHSRQKRVMRVRTGSQPPNDAGAGNASVDDGDHISELSLEG